MVEEKREPEKVVDKKSVSEKVVEDGGKQVEGSIDEKAEGDGGGTGAEEVAAPENVVNVLTSNTEPKVQHLSIGEKNGTEMHCYYGQKAAIQVLFHSAAR